MFFVSCIFEPTVTLNGIPISSCGCQAFIAQRKAEAGLRSPTWHMLGVKKQGTAFWGYTKDKRAAEWLLFFVNI